MEGPVPYISLYTLARKQDFTKSLKSTPMFLTAPTPLWWMCALWTMVAATKPPPRNPNLWEHSGNLKPKAKLPPCATPPSRHLWSLVRPPGAGWGGQKKTHCIRGLSYSYTKCPTCLPAPESTSILAAYLPEHVQKTGRPGSPKTSSLSKQKKT